MQVNILPPGPPALMEAMVFAAPPQQLQQYIYQRNQDLEHRLTTYYGEQGQTFLTQSNQFYQDYVKSSGMREAEVIAQQTVTALSSHSGVIVPLETIEELQRAAGDHIRYLMANPQMTQLMLDNRIDGYAERWTNDEGNAIGFERDAYRIAVNNMGRSSYDPEWSDTQEEQWNACSNSLSDEGQEGLSFQSQVNILRSWNIQNMALLKAIDPSSIDNFDVRPKT